MGEASAPENTFLPAPINYLCNSGNRTHIAWRTNQRACHSSQYMATGCGQGWGGGGVLILAEEGSVSTGAGGIEER